MNNPEEQVRNAIESLNAAFKADPKAIWTLFNVYTTCNEELANHPTIQVITKDVEGKEEHTLGLIGLVNGIIEAALGYRICIMTSEPNEEGQRQLIGFDIYKPESEYVATKDEDEKSSLIDDSSFIEK